jgi:hypothetical protein
MFIEGISAESFLHLLDPFGIEIKKKDYNSFINYIKKDNICNNYICNSTCKKAKILLGKLIKGFCLKEVNIDDLYELIKENASFALKRTSGWKTKKFLLLNDTAKKLKLNCSYANFRYVNKWGYKCELKTYKIIYDNECIYLLIEEEDELDEYIHPQCYVLSKENIYGIEYNHKTVTICKCFKNVFHDNAVKTDAGLDEIFAKHKELKKIDTINKINLTDHFYKGFFYKGLLWDRNWKKGITIMKSVEFVEGRLRIEIENLTYPHSGYVFLDIENGRVLEE